MDATEACWHGMEDLGKTARTMGLYFPEVCVSVQYTHHTIPSLHNSPIQQGAFRPEGGEIPAAPAGADEPAVGILTDGSTDWIGVGVTNMGFASDQRHVTPSMHQVRYGFDSTNHMGIQPYTLCPTLGGHHLSCSIVGQWHRRRR